MNESILKKAKRIKFPHGIPYHHVNGNIQSELYFQINKCHFFIKDAYFHTKREKLKLGAIYHDTLLLKKEKTVCPFCKQDILDSSGAEFSQCSIGDTSEWKEALLNRVFEEINKLSYDYSLFPVLKDVTLIDFHYVKRSSPYWHAKFKWEVECGEYFYTGTFSASHGVSNYPSDDPQEWNISTIVFPFKKCSESRRDRLKERIKKKALSTLKKEPIKKVKEHEKSTPIPTIKSIRVEADLKSSQTAIVFFKIAGRKAPYSMNITLDHHKGIWRYKSLFYYDSKRWVISRNTPSLSWVDHIFDQLSDYLATEYAPFRIRAALKKTTKEYKYKFFTKKLDT